MINIFSNIRDFWSSSSEKDHIIPLHQALELVQQVDVEEEKEDVEMEHEECQLIPENQCFKRTGKIIYIDDHVVTLEDDINFIDCKLTNLKVGDVVSYLAYMKDEKLIISTIQEKIDEWTPKIDEVDSWLTRKLVGKVEERVGRIIKIEPGNYTCDLNKVKTEFVPVVGDWLDVEAITRVDHKAVGLCGDILDVIKISPLRINMITGTVKKWSDELEIGLINSDIFFDKNSCVPGYIPVVKDQVSVEMLESEQDRCCWRAIHVYPEEYSSCTNRLFLNDSNTVLLLQNKNGIDVSNPDKITLNKIGATTYFTITVKNTGDTNRNITGSYFKNSSSEKSQVTLLSPELDDCLEIEAKKSIKFNFSCRGKFMGVTNELFVYKFGDFEIGRFVIVEVLSGSSLVDVKVSGVQRSQKEMLKSAQQDINVKFNRVGGQKPVRPPSFITNKLEMYDIPKRLSDNLFREMDISKFIGEIHIEKVAPVLTQQLDLRNYADHFHNLVYLEELALQINMHKYDMERACFIRNDEFLMLEVPDLSERRPSIILGDKLIAYSPLDPLTKYEGFVHKTGARHVHIKFHQAFHDRYNDEDYTIEFKSSRTNFRRYHQAIDLAVRHLGKQFLFPNQIKLKPPQVNFVVDDDSQTHKANSYVKTLRDILKKGSPNNKENGIGKVEEKEEKLQPALKLQWFDKNLNMYQRRAVENILRGGC